MKHFNVIMRVVMTLTAGVLGAVGGYVLGTGLGKTDTNYAMAACCFAAASWTLLSRPDPEK